MLKYFYLVVAFAAFSYAAPQDQKQNDKYVRPCHPITNQCVSDNLAANSACNKNVQGSLPASYTIDTINFYAPYFNASYIDYNSVIQNQDQCFFSEFFFNLEADSMVLSVDCPNLVVGSNRTLIQHYSKKEDTVYSFSSTWKYPLIRFTTNIRNANAINMCQAFVFTDVTEMPTFVLTPNDQPTKSFLSRDLSYLNIYEREMWSTKGPILFHYFMRNCVCDFGC